MLRSMTEEEKECYEIFGVYEQAVKDLENLNKIYDALTQKKFTFSRNIYAYKEGFVHPDPTGQYEYQFSYFFERGPIGDIKENTLEKMAERIFEAGFFPLDRSDVRLLSNPEIIANFQVIYNK